MKNNSSSARLHALLAGGLVAAVSLVLPAYAADLPPTKATTKQPGKTKAKPMTRDQLRSCMDQQDRLMVMREKVLKEQTSLDQQLAQVKSMDAELERKRAALDPADDTGKQALQDEEMRRNQIGETYNARLPVLKEQGATLDRERQTWVERCADKDFDELDELAIKRERQRAAKASGARTPPK